MYPVENARIAVMADATSSGHVHAQETQAVHDEDRYCTGDTGGTDRTYWL